MTDLSPYQTKQLKRVTVGQALRPWKIGMRLTTAESLTKKGYFKILSPKYSDLGLTGDTLFQRIK